MLTILRRMFSWIERLHLLYWEHSRYKAAEFLDRLGYSSREDMEMLQRAAQQINQWQLLTLQSQRAFRDLAVAFRDSLDYPDVEIDGDLDELVEELTNAVARLEEHITQ